MSYVATTGGIGGEEVRDLMVAAVEHRFGPVNRLPQTIEWLTDNGSGYIATETRRFAREIGLEPRTTPIESPQSNGMAEAFVRTIKRDYVRVSPRPRCRYCVDDSFLRGWPTTMKFIRTGHSATAHPASSSRPNPPRDPVLSFGGNNTCNGSPGNINWKTGRSKSRRSTRTQAVAQASKTREPGGVTPPPCSGRCETTSMVWGSSLRAK